MNFKHGLCKTRAYSVWHSMRQRCYNVKNLAYPRYGGRGIKICDRWQDFEAFLLDMGPPPKGLSIERKDNDKGYSPDNCIWATRTVQARNKSSNFMVTIDGETHPISVWAERSGIKYRTIHRRLLNGWVPEKAVWSPLVSRRRGVPRGRTIHDFDADVIVKTKDGDLPLWKAIDQSGLNPDTVYRRIHRGWDAESAVTLPPRKGRRKLVSSEDKGDNGA